ncbi:MAG: DODA-type extradiol aromatic ring-opening family dioxygenase [Rhodospirillales bacterium]
MSNLTNPRPAPTLFVSHGSPTLPIDALPAREFLRGFGADWDNIKAILVLSAHWERSGKVLVQTTTKPETIHDFFGFPDALYRLRYPAPGAPEAAARAALLLEGAGFAVERDDHRGIDHGVWVPLMLMREAADIPVFQVSIDPAEGPAYHLALGATLAPLRDEGVLILGSGSITHNLRGLWGHGPHDAFEDWAKVFADWMAERAEAGDWEALLDYRARAPQARANHPTDEHLLPFYAALGAGGEGAKAKRIHQSDAFGVLSMDAYSFG